MLADIPELLSFLSQIDSDHQFNIGSPFLRAGLTRIADESIAPGLDSDFMVRSLLYAICGEVRHETQGKAATEEPDSALSPGQMQRLQEMLHEGGKLPTAGELAQHCGVLPRDLSPLIKRTTGVTLRRRSEEHPSEHQSLMRTS